MTRSETLRERWDDFSKTYPALSNHVSRIAQAILNMDRIDPSGVEEAARSQEILDLMKLAQDNTGAFLTLDIADATPKVLLKAVDLYAAELLFHLEK